MSLTNSVPPTASGDVNNSASSSSSYPEQHHAGAVGYGPNYRQGASLGDKLTGLKEELKGKVTKNPGLVEHGREMKSGELKKKEEEEDMNNLDPFGTADDDEDSSTNPNDSQRPTHTNSNTNVGSSAKPDGVTAAATTTENRSGLAKPRDVKYIDEDRSGEHHHHHPPRW
ncbi:hypothetical protein EV359DRAFT_68311 [Lentinula novae-zelandiae]|nr:hypothetical protein EV359DRAFT_68311 [Lentinula novae-zelandiae]